jgi:proton-coupled amino acid transporter
VQFSFVISFTYFVLESMKSVVDEAFDTNIDVIYIGLGAFMVIAPLCLVRNIQRFELSFICADILILLTVSVIFIYGVVHVRDQQSWGDGVSAVNPNTFLTMIGSALFSYEGIGVVLPVFRVTKHPEKFPKILLAVLVTNMLLYTAFGEFCLFAWGNQLEGKPLITMVLPQGDLIVATIKVVFSLNIVISIVLQAMPANEVLETYICGGKGQSRLVINVQRTLIIGACIGVCIMLGDQLDKFNSLIGTFVATPILLTVPCLIHY